MSKAQTLRALVNERLAVAAQEISALFERTTAEYEEELCRSHEENQRKQQILDLALSQRVLLIQGLNQDFTDTAWIKEEPEEQSVTQQEEQLPEPVPESSAVCVKSEESSLFQPRQTEHREETQGENISSEPHFHSETEGDTEQSSDTHDDDDWEPPFSCSAAQMETEASGDHDNQGQTRGRRTKLSLQNKSAAETTVHNKDVSGADGDVRKKHQCSVCTKKFGTKWHLQQHIRVHTGEKPYSGKTCQKSFGHSFMLNRHIRTHTGERPYGCSVCNKAFSQKQHLVTHTRTHTGEKPFSCPTCGKTFAQKVHLSHHRRTHTGERPHGCSLCEKAFSLKQHLVTHTKTHTGEKPFNCPSCESYFAKRTNLIRHIRKHTGEKPFSCPTCGKAFAQKVHLDHHRKTHTGERPHSCTVCGKAFIQKGNLNVHRRTHTATNHSTAETEEPEKPL